MKRISIVIADDHRAVLEDIRELLEAEFDVLGIAVDGRELLSVVEELKPDVVITDISMPYLSGLEATRILIKKNPHLKIILLTVHSDPGVAAEGLVAGAIGYVLKNKAAHDLVAAVYDASR